VQYHHVVGLCAELEQHLFIRFGRPDHIAGRFPEHMSNKNMGVVDWIYAGLRSNVQQGVEGTQIAHESKEKRHQGNLFTPFAVPLVFIQPFVILESFTAVENVLDRDIFISRRCCNPIPLAMYGPIEAGYTSFPVGEPFEYRRRYKNKTRTRALQE